MQACRKALIIAVVLASCSSGDGESQPGIPDGERVAIVVDAETQAGRLDDRYLGLTFDTAQMQHRIDGSDVEGGDDPPDLEDERLQRLAASVGPSILRIGGTDADGVYYCDTEDPCEVPQAYLDAYKPARASHASYFTRKDIRRFADFAEAIDAEIIYCLNFGPGPRDPETDAWTDDNARALVRYARSLPNGDRFKVWEAGNELNIGFVFYNTAPDFGPERYANDIATLRSMVDEEAPGSLVAAPATYFFPDETVGDFGSFTRQVVDGARDSMDMVTWHFYPTQSESCDDVAFPSNAENLFNEEILDKSKRYASYVHDSAQGLIVSMAETASSECGGQIGVSDTQLEALWYSDWIGSMVEQGSSSVVRQTLMGFDYGIVDPDTYEARPTLLALASFQRFVHKARLAIDADRAAIKAHAFCSPEGDSSVTAVLANPDSKTLVGEIAIDGNRVVRATQWTIASADGLEGTRATIEGEAATAEGDVSEPAGTGVHVEDGTAFAAVAPESLVFVTLQLESPAGTCAN